MKNEQHEQAHNLYFQTDLTQTQIAGLINVSRRTIHSWVREGNWDSIKKSAKHLPTVLAQQCYFIMGHLTENILSETRTTEPITSKEAETLHKLIITIGKLKNRCTPNETLELFTFFLDRLKGADPALADQVYPHIEEFIARSTSATTMDFPLVEFNEHGNIPTKTQQQHESDKREKELDRLDDIAIKEQRSTAA